MLTTCQTSERILKRTIKTLGVGENYNPRWTRTFDKKMLDIGKDK